MAKRKRNKPKRKIGNPNSTKVPFTRAHSNKIKYTKKQLRNRKLDGDENI